MLHINYIRLTITWFLFTSMKIKCEFYNILMRIRISELMLIYIYVDISKIQR